jgi:hypothetical protein
MSSPTFWNGNPPPQDGSFIVAVGAILSVSNDGGESAPFTETIRWDNDSNEWLNQHGLSLGTFLGETVTIHHWMPAPTSEAPATLPIFLPADEVGLLRAVCSAAGICADEYVGGILGTMIRDTRKMDPLNCNIVNDILDGYTFDDPEAMRDKLWEAVEGFTAGNALPLETPIVRTHPHVPGLLPVYLPEDKVKLLNEIFTAEDLLCPENYGDGEKWLAPSSFIFAMVETMFEDTLKSAPHAQDGIPFFLLNEYQYSEDERGLPAAHAVIERWKKGGES